MPSSDQANLSYLALCNLTWAVHLSTNLPVRGDNLLSNARKAKRQPGTETSGQNATAVGCLEGLENAVLLSVSKVTWVTFNREVIIRYKEATVEKIQPPAKCSPVSGIIQERGRATNKSRR